MSIKNDISMIQRWICCWRGKEDQDNYLSQIGSGPDNDVGDAVSCLKGVGYEVKQNSRGDLVVVKIIRGACNASK